MRLSLNRRHNLELCLLAWGALLMLPTWDLHAQISCTQEQAEMWFDLEGEQEDTLVSTDGWKARQFRARPKGKASPTFLISFHEGKAACIRAEASPTVELQEVMAGLKAFAWRVEGDERINVKWEASQEFISAYPPVGRSSQSIMPLTRTIGRKRTVTFDTNTGEVLGATPWRDIDVPTGRFQINQNHESCSIDTLVSEDGFLYARMVSFSYRFGNVASDFASQFLICDAEYFWQLSSRCIVEAKDKSPYESSFNKFVPEQLHAQARKKRLGFVLAGLTSTSALEPKVLLKLANEIEEPREHLLGTLAHRLHKQKPAAQLRRMELLAHLFGPKAIPTLVTMVQQPRDVGGKAAQLLRKIADEHGLKKPPAEGANAAKWKQWASEAAPE